MKPQVVCLMASSVDGRIPQPLVPSGGGCRVVRAGARRTRRRRLARPSGHRAGVRQGQAVPNRNGRDVPTGALVREPQREGLRYGLDAHGKISWGRSDIGGDPIVVVLTEAVSDAHLAGLRSEGVSYFFAGKSELDLAVAVDILSCELGVKRLLLEGGGGANGGFLRAGLVDEFNLILCPAVDGAKGAPSVFDSPEAETNQLAPVTAMTLESSRTLEGGAMLLRYQIQKRAQQPTRFDNLQMARPSAKTVSKCLRIAEFPVKFRDSRKLRGGGRDKHCVARVEV
jgi:RibD C-terminal domain